MPGMVVFGRRWGVGSDDLVFPGVAEIIFRLIWLVAISAVYGVHRTSFSCDKGVQLQIYYIGAIVLLAVSIICSVWIVVLSSRGTISHSAPRTWLTQILYIKLFLSLVELVWLILGTYWAFTHSSTCENHVLLTMKIAVCMGWFVAVVVIIGIGVVFDPLGKHDRYSLKERQFRRTAKLWEQRCRLLCCCTGNDEHSKNAFSEVAHMLSDFFLGIDFVATDIAAGLILVQIEQEKKERNQGLTEVCSLEAVSVSDGAQPQEIPDWFSLKQVSYYMKYAVASYGWPMYMFANLCCGMCMLCSQCRCACCCCCRRDQEAVIIKDNCCECNTAAIRKTIGVENVDLLYTSYHNKIYETPFYVAVDHNKKSIVVAVRGTLSLKDALTDMIAESEPMDIQELQDQDCEAHKGILQAAKYVFAKLEELKILQQFFQDTGHRDYNLVVLGHSLGAGTASLLALLLRPQFPDLMCYAYSPPGGLVSPPIAKYSEKFICSVVLGQDLIPRLSLVAMENLKINVMQCIKESHKPKYKILASGLWYILCGMPKETDSQSARQHLLSQPSRRYDQDTTDGDTDRLFEDHVDSDDSDDELTDLIDEAIENSAHKRMEYRILHPPGRIIHIVEDTDLKFRGFWKRPEDFSEIRVSARMVTDHLPDRVQAALEDLNSSGAILQLMPQKL